MFGLCSLVSEVPLITPSHMPSQTAGDDTLRTLTTKALDIAFEDSTAEWKKDLRTLFNDAENRFPDIVWKTDGKEVWAHKGAVSLDPFPLVLLKANTPFLHEVIVFAQESPAISRHYPASENHSDDLDDLNRPHSPKSRLWLQLPGDEETGHVFRNPRAGSNLSVFTTTADPLALVKDILALYTADDRLAGTGTHPSPEINQDGHSGDNKLFRNSLIEMWRSRFYVDIQINVPWFGQDSTQHREKSVSRFWSHRSVLMSRSPFFRDLLIGESGSKTLITVSLKTTRSGSLLITLPFPPFTPSSFYYILGYIYSGVLNFRPDREFDLQTAFSIVRGSIYLRIPTLQKLIVAHIAVKMLHGLFHAYLPNTEYLRLVQASWNKMSTAGGCKCKACVIRIPRVLQFALGSNVHSYILQRGARRALIGIFGRGWCSNEFASIPRNIRDSILKNVLKMVVPQNALALLFAAEEGLERLDEVSHSWGSTIRIMILSVRDSVDELLCRESRACFDSEDWRNMVLTNDDDTEAGMDDVSTRKDRLEWIMIAILRTVDPMYTTSVYQTLNLLSIPDDPKNFFLQAIIEHIKSELLNIMGPMLSSSTVTLPESDSQQSTHFSFVTAEAEVSQLPRSYYLSESGLAWNQSTASIYSDISEQTIPWSVAGPIDTSSESPGILALDLANISLYSHASSRTLSTDYGVFYTRHALSANESSSTLRRRRSWDSFTSTY